ncbi:hypothetical protein M7I_0700 [Glarea lozoyensis 74030]|uniref:Uncharacterized protein n=1 Tax=Glarea lozoyensis (strain ATCC 74030 / MF5533) TaxID=1104152 RepID=H0EE32_GLAL7|nr:hypothetical protein M7I_0700 [Glarea lozoyensis 74030]
MDGSEQVATRISWLGFAGLARQRHAFVKDEYIAGLWWRTAIHGLCWMSHGGLGKIHRITPYVAPTWSCLSINNEILLNGNFTLDEDRINPLERLHVHVQSVAITLASADRFGAITKATMRLACGHMLKCKLRDMEDTPIEIRGHNKSLMTSLTADCFSNPLIKQFIDQGLSAQVDDVQVEPFEFYIVPIKSAGPYATFAMMLLPVPGQQGVYERVGSTFPYVVATPEWREAFENENCQPMPEECVSIDVDERGRKIFVIDLV